MSWLWSRVSGSSGSNNEGLSKTPVSSPLPAPMVMGPSLGGATPSNPSSGSAPPPTPTVIGPTPSNPSSGSAPPLPTPPNSSSERNGITGFARGVGDALSAFRGTMNVVVRGRDSERAPPPSSTMPNRVELDRTVNTAPSSDFRDQIQEGNRQMGARNIPLGPHTESAFARGAQSVGQAPSGTTERHAADMRAHASSTIALGQDAVSNSPDARSIGSNATGAFLHASATAMYATIGGMQEHREMKTGQRRPSIS